MTLDRNQYLASVDRLIEASSAYYASLPPVMSDEEYDRSLEEVQAASDVNGWREAEGLLTQVAGGTSGISEKSIVLGKGKVAHSVPMLSLAKIKTEEEVLALVKNDNNVIWTFEPKLDGQAISATYLDGKLALVATRGNGTIGEDITAAIRLLKPKGLPLTVLNFASFEVRGELVMTDEDFVIAQKNRPAGEKPYANPRNATAGAVTNANFDSRENTSSGFDNVSRTVQKVYPPTTFYIYDVAVSQGNTDVESHSEGLSFASDHGLIPASQLLPENFKTLSPSNQIKEFGVLRDKLGVPTDGAVFKVDDLALREKMGATSRHPRWALAYKYEAEVGESTLSEIERQVGRTGAISYVAHLNPPVEIEGSVVSKATLNNSSFIEGLDLHLGDTVYVRKANSIIPEIISVNLSRRTPNLVPYKAPTTCPKCGSELDTTSSLIWRCPNPEDSIATLISYAVSRDILNVEHLSTALVSDLILDNRIKDLADIYTLTVEELASTQTYDDNGKPVYNKVSSKTGEIVPRRWGMTVAKKIHANIEASKQQPLSRILPALGIRYLGRTFGRRLTQHFGTLKSIQAASIDDLQQVEAISSLRAESIYEGLKRNQKLLEKLEAAGFAALSQTKPQPTVQPANSYNSNSYAGKSIVFTGSVPGYTRTEIGDFIASLGAKPSSSVSQKTDFLVAGENAGSKLAKAEQLGVKIVPALEFLKSLK